MYKLLSFFALVAVFACGGRTGDARLPAGMGGIQVQLHGTTSPGTIMGEIIIQNVFDPTQNILQNCVAKPELLDGEAFCDNMNVLQPGVYEIKVESQTGCTMTQDHYKAVVNAGQTTEVKIGLVCDPNGGGLDVVVTENHKPVITDLLFFTYGGEGNKYICRFGNPVGVAPFVQDPENAGNPDPCTGLTGSWSRDGAPVDPADPLFGGFVGPFPSAGVPPEFGVSPDKCYWGEYINTFSPAGTYNLDFTVTDATGLSATLQYPIHLIDCLPPVANPATYDPVLQAPACSTVADSCDSGTLLYARDHMFFGTEPNAPNTIYSSCADGASGRYHEEESLDELKIATLDGTPLAAGKTVRVEAKVWSDSPTDYLDIYTAADATSPVWVFQGEVLAPVRDGQTLSLEFVLPPGTSLQAIRGVFRYGGTAAPCTTGMGDDHDDLVFAVAP